jgi:PhnB protein
MAVQPIPNGFHTVTPYLIVPKVADLIDFLKRAFDATEINRHADPQGNIRHAEVRIGDSPIMMGQANEQWKSMPSMIHLYVPDADAVYKKALSAGATSLAEPANQFYGDRSAGVQDTSGNMWWIATHIEDVSPEEMQKRAAAQIK